MRADYDFSKGKRGAGFKVESIRVIQDSVTGASPAFGYISLYEERQKTDAVQALNGQKLRGSIVEVKEDWRKNDDQISTPRPHVKRREVNYILTLDEIADLAKHADKPAETLVNVVALIAKHFQTDVCSAYLLEPDRANLVLAATLVYAAVEAVFVIVDGGSDVTAGWGIAYGVLATGGSVIVWQRLARRAGSADVLMSEATAWKVSALRGIGMIVGFSILGLLMAPAGTMRPPTSTR
jgi:hypothetical protein